MAIYYEPNGPCRTKCSGSKIELEEGGFSVQISDLPAAAFADMLGDLAPAEFLDQCRESSQVISHSGRHDSLQDLLQAVGRNI